MTKFKGQVASIAPLLGIAAGLLVGPSIASAQSVTTTGDILYTAPLTTPTWNAGAETYVGNTSTGGLSVLAGGTLNGANLEIGHATGSIGNAIVDGAGSSLTTTHGLTIGAAGNGTLSITNGGHVRNNDTSGDGYLYYTQIGSLPGGTGLVTVDGAGSSLVNDSYVISVGGNGSTGTLIVSNGGATSAQGYYIGGGGSTTPGGPGTVLVTGAGSTLTQSGGGVFVGTGPSGLGSITVANGGAVNDEALFDGFNGSTGTVTITGAGSTWNTSQAWRIGYGGTGTANIENGATATVASFALIGMIGGTGTETVTGPGSTFTASGGIGVGYAQGATGTLTIADSAVFNTTSVLLAGVDADTTATLNIGAAAGSAAVAAGTLNSPTVTFGPGTGVLNFNHTSTGLDFGAAISSGTGSATINQIAGVTNLTGDSSGFGATSVATTNVSGGTLGVTGMLGGAQNLVNVTDGTLAASAGGIVMASTAFIGNGLGNTGTGTVSGTGSLLQASAIRVGSQLGTGTLTIDEGGTATANKVTVGGTSTNDNVAPGGTGTLNVAGAGSTLNQTGSGAGFFIGSDTSNGPSNGTVNVSAGAVVNSATTFLGFAGGTGAIKVDGAGSTWTESGSWRVGYSDSASVGTGTVTISNGGAASVNGQYAIFGLDNGTGALTVTGNNSTFDSANPVYLGYGIGAAGSANGTMTIADGAVVTAPTINLGFNLASASGTINIGAAAGSAAVAAGTLDTASIVVGIGTGVVNFNHTSTGLDFGAAISSGTGSATINQIAGVTNLTGDSSGFGGATNVTGGTLLVNGTLGDAASTVAVSSGGTLGGAGTIGGSVTIADGILAPGNSGAGTLTIAGNLALGSATQLDYDLGAANVVGGALNDLTEVGGNLTLGGTLNVTQSTGGNFGPGIYRLIDYTGTLTNNGLALGSMPAGSTDYVQTSVANQVNLVNSNGLFLNFWDGAAGGKNDGVISGGDGRWVAGTAGGTDDWTQADGLINAPYQDAAFAVFTGAAGTVTVDDSLGAVRVSGMDFATTGYHIQGGPIVLVAGIDAIRVGDGTLAGATTIATVASALTGTGTLDKVDLGTLALTSANTYTGGTTIAAGTLQLGNGGTTGSILGDVTDNATLAFDRSDAVAFAGVISGTGSVSQIGTGSTTLAAANTYTGGTLISAGTLIGSATSFGSGAIADNAALVINQPTNASFANVISGTGSLLKSGAGTLALTSANTYTGDTTIAAGTLQLGNGGTTGSILGDVTDNATLAFDRSDAVAFAGVISGTGSVSQIGTGSTTLAAANTYTGGTLISAGTLIGSATSFGSGAIADNAALVINQPTNASFANVISGTGSLLKSGAGTLALTSANTYTGGTTIAAGTLQLGNGGTSGSIVRSVVDNGALAFDRSDVVTFAGAITGTGAVNQTGSGTTILTSASTYAGATNVSAGTLAAGAANVYSANSAFNVGSSGMLALQGFNQAIASLSNAGTVSLAASSTSTPGTVLSLAGNYAGSAGKLVINTVLGSDASLTDRLVVGGNATGTTLTTVNNVGGLGALTKGNGIEIVKVGGTSTAGAFVLANGPLNVGAFRYQLYEGGAADATSQDWFLRSQTRPIVQPSIALARISQDVALTMLGTLHERVGEQENLSAQGASSGFLTGMWGRMIGKQYTDRSRSSAYGDGRSTGDIGGLQLGVDLYRGMASDGYQTHIGVYGGHAWAGSSEYAIDSTTPHAGSTKTDGWVVGAYATHYGKGWYADAVVQSSFLKLHADGNDSTTFQTKSNTWLGSLELGAPLKVGSGFVLEPEAQVIYGSTNLNDNADSTSVLNSFAVKDSVTGRLGFRLKRTWDYDTKSAAGLFTPYIKANVWSRLSGGDTILTVAGSAPGVVSYGKTWGDVGGGTTYGLSSSADLFIDTAVEFGLSAKGTSALTGHAGFRLRF